MAVILLAASACDHVHLRLVIHQFSGITWSKLETNRHLYGEIHPYFYHNEPSNLKLKGRLKDKGSCDLTVTGG